MSKPKPKPKPKPDLNLEFEAFIAMGETDPKIKSLVDAIIAWYKDDKTPWTTYFADGTGRDIFTSVFGDRQITWAEFCRYLETKVEANDATKT